jgi:hypothetical protein
LLLLRSFEYFDKDRSNSLNYDEILCALQHAGARQHTARSTTQHTQRQTDTDCLMSAGRSSTCNGHPPAVVLMCLHVSVALQMAFVSSSRQQ